MSKKHLQPSLLETSVSAQGEQQQAIFHRLGLEALPTHETRWLPLARIQVSAEQKVRVPTSLVQSIKLVGVLQAPSVVRISPPEVEEEQALYQVIAGRRRTKAAKRARLTVLKVEVYEYTTPQLSAFLALIENAQRSAAWIKEVADLRLLVSQRVEMTEKELIACGFARRGLSERLKMARLPAPLLEQIVSGTVTQEVARKLVRLKEEDLARVVQIAQDEPLTETVVSQALRAQIDSRLLPAQTGFPIWDTDTQAQPTHMPLEETALTECVSLAHILQTLRAFTHSEAYWHVQESHLLTQALIQRLETAERTQQHPPSHLRAS